MSLINAVSGVAIPASNGSTFPITPEMTSIAVQYRNDAQTLIADDVMPMTAPLGTKAFKHTVFDLGNNYTIPDIQIGPRSKVNTYEVSGKEITEDCIDYGLKAFIPTDDIDQAQSLRVMNQSVIDPMMLHTEMLTDIVILARERRVANIVFNPENYTDDLCADLTADNNFSTPTSSPIELIEDYLDGTIVRPNVLVFGRLAWSALRRHPDIVKAANRNAGDKGVASKDAVAELFEVNKILVGDSYVNFSKDRENPMLARTWGPHMAGIYWNPAAIKVKGMTWGYTGNYRGRVAGALPDPNTGARGGMWVQVVETCREVVVAKEAGFLLTNVTVPKPPRAKIKAAA